MNTTKKKGFFSIITDWQSYKNIVYLLSLLPVGIVTFTVSVTLVAVSIGLIFTPAWMWTSDPLTLGSWTFDPFPYSPICTVIGIILLPIALRLMNATTGLSRRLVQITTG